MILTMLQGTIKVTKSIHEIFKTLVFQLCIIYPFIFYFLCILTGLEARMLHK